MPNTPERWSLDGDRRQSRLVLGLSGTLDRIPGCGPTSPLWPPEPSIRLLGIDDDLAHERFQPPDPRSGSPCAPRRPPHWRSRTSSSARSMPAGGT